MDCRDCGRALEADAAFCSGCGADQRSRCPGCERAAEPGARFCAGCGTPLSDVPAVDPDEPLLRGERRVATVMFSDLTGYTNLGERLDPEDVAAILAEIKDAATRAIESHGGTVNQFVGDEVMALFGIPVSHGDDARRAIAAAFELHAFVRSLAGRFDALPEPLTLHTGVYTGLVVAQHRDRREGLFSATGDAVNTAARLLAAAGPDEVFVGPETAAAIEGYFDTEAVGALELKGKRAALETRRVLGPSATRSGTDAPVSGSDVAPLMGRADAWSRLESALIDARRHGAMVRLVGEAGVGKSHLAHAFCLDAAQNGAIVLRGACQAFGRVTPYHPIIEAMRGYLGVTQGDSPDAIVERVAATAEALGPGSDRHVPALLHLLSVESDAYEFPASFSPEELPSAICDAIAAALGALAAGGVVVLHLEDWHWADEASASLLPLLTRRLADAPVLLLVDQRPTPDEASVVEREDRVLLAVFDLADVEALVAHALGSERVQPELVAVIAERTGGNPLFIEEVCASLIERGALARRSREIGVRGRIEELEIPESVQAVLRSRIDVLDSRSRDVLRIASVVGSDVPPPVLEGVLSDTVDLAARIDDLARADLLVRDGESLRFRHVTIREVAYETMLRSERAEVHRQVGEVLENLHGEARVAEAVEALAHHFHLGGDEDRSLRYSEQAAWKAARSFAFANAREHFGRAIQLLEAREAVEPDDSAAREWIDLTMRWAEVNLFGPSLQQIPQLERALARAHSLGEAQRAVTLSYWISWVHYAVGAQRKAIASLEQIVEAVRPAGDDFVLGMMQLGLGQAYAIQRDSRAQATLEEGLGRRLGGRGSRGIGEAHVLGAAGALDTFSVCQIALICAYRGDADESEERFREAIESVRRIGTRSTESSNWITFGLAALLVGRWESAVAAAREARGIAEHMRSPYHLDTSDAIEGYARVRLGERAEGRALLERAVDALERSGTHLSWSLTLASYADVLADAGEWEAAEARALAALACAEDGECMGDDFALRVLYRVGRGREDAGAAETWRKRIVESADARACPRERALAAALIDGDSAPLRALGLDGLEPVGSRALTR